MVLTFRGNVFVAQAPLIEHATARHARFLYRNGEWVTPSPQVAARLRAYADERAEKLLNSSFINYAPWSGRIQFPKSETPRSFQLRAARFALERDRSYLAIDPGGGKTIVSALVLNALGPHPVVIVVPPSLVANWEYELDKWLTWPKHAQRPFILPDSLIVDPDSKRKAQWEKFQDYTNLGGATLIVDEAHRFKSETAKRTKTLLGEMGLWRYFERIVLLSGTPMPNRPMELFPVLNRLAPETIGFRNYFSYGQRYCEAYKDHFGWHFDGASNVAELANSVHGKFMLRLRKSEILKELGPKTEEIVVLAQNAPPKLMDIERGLLRKHSPEDLMKYLASNGHISTYRRMLGLAKVPLVISFVRELLSDTDESILLFAEHVEVVEKLTAGLMKYCPIVITGATPKNQRQPLVNKFQTRPEHRVFIGNMKAAGVGFNLTKARRVGLIEPSWVPADNEQASDRSHRIGQKENVLVQYFVFKNSLDRSIIETNLRKRKATQLI